MEVEEKVIEEEEKNKESTWGSHENCSETPQNANLQFILSNHHDIQVFTLTWTQSLNPTLAAAVDLGYINSIQRALNFALSFQICKVCF